MRQKSFPRLIGLHLYLVEELPGAVNDTDTVGLHDFCILGRNDFFGSGRQYNPIKFGLDRHSLQTIFPLENHPGALLGVALVEVPHSEGHIPD